MGGMRISGADRRVTIVTAASELFSTKGFSASTRQIAAELGVTQALLYWYFPSKDALIDAVFEHFRQRWDGSKALVLEAPGRPLVDRLSEFYLAYINRHAGTPMVRLFVRAALDGIDLAARYRGDLDQTVLRPILTACQRELGLPPPPQCLSRDARELILGLHGAVVFVGLRRHVYHAPIDDERHFALVHQVLESFTPGMLARIAASQDVVFQAAQPSLAPA